jgi:hypothetical protein
MRLSIALLIGAVFALPAAGQDAGMDHTIHVKGSGKLPGGWNARFDQSGSALTDIDVKQAGSLLQFRSGPAAIYWNTRDVATGYFTVSAIFNQRKSVGHEAYGLFVGGQNLSDPTQNYLYFAIKPMDGTFLINHRNGMPAPRAFVALTPSPAINRDAAGTGAATNAIAIRVAKDSVHFYINGQEVRAYSKAALGGAPTDGIAGLRINHNIEVEVKDFGVKR